LLRQLRDHLLPEGVLIVSVPNFAHWYPRARVATGRFGYDRRGILDETHLRFFTRRSFQRLALRSGWHAEVIGTTGATTSLLRTDPNEASRVDRSAQPESRSHIGEHRKRPALLTYQYLFQLVPNERQAPTRLGRSLTPPANSQS
jgi:hypothetical protein